MLCFNLKLANFFRVYKEESVRDRSQSLCTPPTKVSNRDIGALRVLQRRASSAMYVFLFLFMYSTYCLFY